MISFVLHAGREKSLLRHHPWIFSKAVDKVLTDARADAPVIDKKEIKSGTLCQVLSSELKFLCYAHFSPYSQIMLRAISFRQEDRIDYDFIKGRIASAMARRGALKIRGDHGIRLVSAEGDYMPGLIVDRFNNVISVAISSSGMESCYNHIFRALHELNPDCYLYERSDAKSRSKENLPLRAGLVDPEDLSPAYNLKDKAGNGLKDSKQITSVKRIVTDADSASQSAADGAAMTSENLSERISLDEAIPDTLFVLERGLVEIPIDVKHGHKTGGYLDQRQSRYHTYELCKTFKALSEDGKTGPTVLNCFSYTGGFSLHALKGGAKAVFNVDVSDNALNAARQGVVHNHLDPGRCKFINKDVFEYLRQEVKKGTKFDIVILDPPKFAENKSNLVSACRGYQDINRLGMQLVRSGGRLLTFSCSGLMTEDLFQKIIADAALEANVEAQLVTTLRQDIDHVVSLPCPETFYLKGFEILIN
ncbi:class I SAM-dependent methyltransferase [uncultured Anaerobiospirillum sp.]|uniref:class I SAM-dependent rRNA methyltransferase n=1 Tax=uncultured Anaerobiospirillum sp. TaxID=265728 RepID=UPI0028063EBA|nr:class I SAM-dependent methyltransferase [uncultured Anaerobiospirillum sp.]